MCIRDRPLCILGNLAVPLGLVYSLSDRFTPKAYYIYVMEFVFLEMLPVSGSAILTRFFALFYGLLVFAAAFYCYARRAKRRRHYGTVRKGMKTLATQLENRALGTPDDGLAQTLATLCAHMSHVVYTLSLIHISSCWLVRKPQKKPPKHHAWKGPSEGFLRRHYPDQVPGSGRHYALSQPACASSPFNCSFIIVHSQQRCQG